MPSLYQSTTRQPKVYPARCSSRPAQVKYAMRGGNDAVAAVKVLKGMPDIDPDRIFVQGYSYGATSSLFATDAKTPGAHDTQIAGVIAYYPYCYDNLVPSRPTLVLI